MENRRSGAQKEGKKAAPPAVDLDFDRWVQSLEGRFASHLEKMRERFLDQRKRASMAGRELIDRKLAKLNELLDGPQPEWVKPREPAPAAKPSLAQTNPKAFKAQGKKLVAEMRKAAGL